LKYTTNICKNPSKNKNEEFINLNQSSNLQLRSEIAGNGIPKQAPIKSATIKPPINIFVDD
jgi:hypothetical protein